MNIVCVIHMISLTVGRFEEVGGVSVLKYWVASGSGLLLSGEAGEV